MKNTRNKLLKAARPALLAIAAFAGAVAAQSNPGQPSEIVASGGPFALEKAVTAGGGNRMSQAALNQSGTAGQPLAGVRSTGGQFALYSGFWTPDQINPTAASAVVGGRITTASGHGIRHVSISITFPSGEIRSTLSSAFGYYRFADIPVGGVYTVTIAAKRYRFNESTRVFQLQDDLTDVDFVANDN